MKSIYKNLLLALALYPNLMWGMQIKPLLSQIVVFNARLLDRASYTPYKTFMDKQIPLGVNVGLIAALSSILAGWTIYCLRKNEVQAPLAVKMFGILGTALFFYTIHGKYCKKIKQNAPRPAIMALQNAPAQPQSSSFMYSAIPNYSYIELRAQFQADAIRQLDALYEELNPVVLRPEPLFIQEYVLPSGNLTTKTSECCILQR